jgi:hypothetical protein
VHHFIGYTVIACTGMDEYAGCVAKFPTSFVGEHGEESMLF